MPINDAQSLDQHRRLSEEGHDHSLCLFVSRLSPQRWRRGLRKLLSEPSSQQPTETLLPSRKQGVNRPAFNSFA